MAPIITPVSAIVAGKINIKLHVRVINVWTVSEFHNPAETSSIHMLLLDEKLGKIHASAKKVLVPKIRAVVQEGQAYEIQNVLVTHTEPKYQMTGHRFRLNLIDRTLFKKIDNSSIPAFHFDFVSFREILDSTREDRFVDVIGHVVERDVLKEKDVNGKKSKVIDITLEDNEGNRVHCSLWDNHAVRMDAYLTVHGTSSPMVVIIHLCKLKRYYGAMGISNAFYGTKLILDDDFPAVKEYRSKMDGAEIEVTQGVSQTSGALIVPLADDLLQSKMMTIEDLIESSDLCNVIVLASICGIEPEYGWYYQACTKCAGRVKIISGRMFCPRCNQSRTAVPRFKLHVQVMDNTGSTSFILFDRNVSSYVGRSVQDLIDTQGQGGSSLGYPSVMDVLVGKQMLFKVEITNGNLLHGWRNYGVKRTSDDADLIKQFMKLHNLKALNEEDDNGGITLSLTQDENVQAEIGLLEAGDSTKTAVNEKDEGQTPGTKSGGKRSADAEDSDIVGVEEIGERSINKPVKLKCVKIEKNA